MTITGHRFPPSVLPRQILDSSVLVVDAENRLRFRDVEVLRMAADDIYVSAGLTRGERVIVSSLQNTAEGMLVRLADAPDAAHNTKFNS